MRQNHHHLRLDRNHVGSESEQHLRRGLAAYPAVHIRLARKKFAVSSSLGIGDRIAHEDHSLLIRRGLRDLRMLVTITREVRPVAQGLLIPLNQGLKLRHFSRLAQSRQAARQYEVN